MPFIALHKETKQRIDITTIAHPREVLKSGDCVCQLCGTPMIVRAGEIMQAHFAHWRSCSNTEYQSNPESPAHLEAKRFLASHLPHEFPEYRDAKIEYEVPIREVMRIADLLVTWPNGHRKAMEVQLSSITIEHLQKRTNDYVQAGIDVIWWLGKNAKTPANITWSDETFGFHCCIN